MSALKPIFCGKCGNRLSSVRDVRYNEQTGKKEEYGEESLMCRDTIGFLAGFPCFTQYFFRNGGWVRI